MRAAASTAVVLTLLVAGMCVADTPPLDSTADPAIFSAPPALGEAEATLVGYPTIATPSYAGLATPPPDGMPVETGVTMDMLHSEIEKYAWKKGDMKIVPYGSFWGSMIYQTERTYPGAYTLWVESPDDQGEEAFTLDVRRTRLGIDVSGPRIWAFGCAESGGKVEIDFHGSFVTENKAGVLLRHAYWETKDDHFRFLVGQTWDVISPLIPGDLAYSVLWGQGNIGYRRAQVRYERYFDIGCHDELIVQTSINQNIVNDFATTTGVHRESSGWPVLEGRVAWTNHAPAWAEGPATLGFSGHVGEQGFDFTTVGPPPLNLPPADDVRVKTWSANVDLKVPLTKHTGIQGEAFYGYNLSTFLGGIVQGVCPCTRSGIHSRGGWIDVWHEWSPCSRSHVGYGVDDPDNNDMYFGRGYNSVIFLNYSRDITKFLIVGAELTYNKTLFHETRVGQTTPEPGKSVGIEFTAQYKF